MKLEPKREYLESESKFLQLDEVTPETLPMNKRYLLSDNPAVIAAKKQYMQGFNINCKTCISKNESINSGAITENS